MTEEHIWTQEIKIKEECRKLHTLYSSTSINRVIKSSRMRMEGHVVQMDEISAKWLEHFKRLLTWPRYRDFREIGYKDV
jgi:hypothetical protein